MAREIAEKLHAVPGRGELVSGAMSGGLGIVGFCFGVMLERCFWGIM